MRERSSGGRDRRGIGGLGLGGAWGEICGCLYTRGKDMSGCGKDR